MLRNELKVAALESVAPAGERMISIDVLRGFDMFWIAGGEGIVQALAKANGDKPTGLLHFLVTQLNHKAWEGFAFYDLIFPLFLFLVGVSIVFSLGRIKREESLAAARARVFRRFALMFLLGLFYYGGFSHAWPGVRILGVLQRLALGYLFASLLYLHLGKRGLAIALAVVLIGYWAIMSFVPMPGLAGVSFQPDMNIANYIDLHYLPGRLNDKTWDPEGILSTIPAIGTALLGVFTGLLLRDKQYTPYRKVFLLAGAGVAMVALGFLWGLQFPVIKKLWTSSYVLVAGGYSCLLVAAFYWLVDIRQSRWWTGPFLWIGSNALAVYFACRLFDFEKLASFFVGGDIAALFGEYGELLNVSVAMLLVIYFARWLYVRKHFLRI